MVQATRRVIVAAEHWAVLGRVMHRDQRQGILQMLATFGVEVTARSDFIATALRPIARTAFGYVVAKDLVHLQAVRIDLRNMFSVLESMVTASHQISVMGTDASIAAAEELISAISDLYQVLPVPRSPFAGMVRHASADSEAAYKAALTAAWEAHKRLRAAS